MKRALVWLAQKGRTPTGLLVMAFLALSLSLVKDLSEKGAAALTTVGILGVVASLGKALKEAGILQKIWDHFAAPQYPEVQTYLSRIGGPDLGALTTRKSDGLVCVNSVALVQSYEHLIRRIRFCGDDPEWVKIASRINAKAFSGSKYQASFDQKLERNSKICSKSRESIAIISAPDDETVFTAMSGVFPISHFYYTPYVLGQISDNEVKHHHIAESREDMAAILFFMVAHCPYKAGKFLPKQAGMETVADLIGCAMIQSFMLAAAGSGAGRSECLVANSSHSMKSLFSSLGFVERVNMNTKDNERLYSLQIEFENTGKALRLVRKLNPALLRPA